MASKGNLYRPLRLTEVYGGSTEKRATALSPTSVTEIRPCVKEADREAECWVSVKDKGAALRVWGDVLSLTAAWEAALKGAELTPAEWGYEPPVPQNDAE